LRRAAAIRFTVVVKPCAFFAGLLSAILTVDASNSQEIVSKSQVQ
jgi:hypothetical protein